MQKSMPNLIKSKLRTLLHWHLFLVNKVLPTTWYGIIQELRNTNCLTWPFWSTEGKKVWIEAVEMHRISLIFWFFILVQTWFVVSNNRGNVLLNITWRGSCLRAQRAAYCKCQSQVCFYEPWDDAVVFHRFSNIQRVVASSTCLSTNISTVVGQEDMRVFDWSLHTPAQRGSKVKSEPKNENNIKVLCVYVCVGFRGQNINLLLCTFVSAFKTIHCKSCTGKQGKRKVIQVDDYKVSRK